MDIVYETSRLDDDSYQKIKDHLNKILIDFNLQLDSLDKINVTDNMLESVINFQQEKKLSEKGMTHGENGIAIAKVMNYVNHNGEFKQEIFIEGEIFFGAFQNDTKLARECLHTIHHELVHVQDNFIKRNSVYSKSDNRANALDRLVTEHADIIWSEFIAERLSVISLSKKDIINKIDHVKTLLIHTEEEVNKAKETNDANFVFRTIQEESSLTLKIIGNLMGMLQGLFSEMEDKQGTSKQQHVNLDDIFKDTFMEEYWEDLYGELDSLYSTYNDWTDITVFDELGLTIRAIWHSLGIYTSKNRINNSFSLELR